jgi:hypothetical protein
MMDRDNTQDPFSQTHPVTMVDVPPAEAPRCVGPFAGYNVKVWGKGFADFICITVNFHASHSP